MLHLLPYALAAYGGIQGYKGAREAGVGGLGSLVHGALGAYGGYSMGSAGMGMFPGSAATSKFAAMPLTQSLTRIPGISPIQTPTSIPGMNATGEATFASDAIKNFPSNVGDKTKSGSLLDILRNKDAAGNITKGYDPLKVGGSLAALTYRWRI